jgi:hypothetical protein
MYINPRDVASSLPIEPPSSTGFPVTTWGVAEPSCIDIVSMIQAMVWASV